MLYRLRKDLTRQPAKGILKDAVQWSLAAFYSGLTGGSASMNSQLLTPAIPLTPPYKAAKLFDFLRRINEKIIEFLYRKDRLGLLVILAV